jgi:hypothetical protein
MVSSGQIDRLLRLRPGSLPVREARLGSASGPPVRPGCRRAGDSTWPGYSDSDSEGNLEGGVGAASLPVSMAGKGVWGLGGSARWSAGEPEGGSHGPRTPSPTADAPGPRSGDLTASRRGAPPARRFRAPFHARTCGSAHSTGHAMSVPAGGRGTAATGRLGVTVTSALPQPFASVTGRSTAIDVVDPSTCPAGGPVASESQPGPGSSEVFNLIAGAKMPFSGLGRVAKVAVDSECPPNEFAN